MHMLGAVGCAPGARAPAGCPGGPGRGCRALRGPGTGPVSWGIVECVVGETSLPICSCGPEGLEVGASKHWQAEEGTVEGTEPHTYPTPTCCLT